MSDKYVPTDWSCGVCQMNFDTKRGLSQHNRFKHTIGQDDE